MKILHLTTHLNSGGITTYIYDLCRMTQEMGHECLVASADGEQGDLFRSAEIKTLEIPIRTKSILHPKVLLSAAQLSQYLKKNPVDIIHAHTRVTQVLAQTVSNMTKIPFITTCHGFYKRRLGRKILPAWGKKVIAISDGVEEYLNKTMKVSGRDIYKIYNGIHIGKLDCALHHHDLFELRKKYEISPEDFVMVIIARLVKEKGHFDLLAALKKLPKESPYKLLIVGEGREKKHLQNIVSEDETLSKKVTFTGNLDDVSEALAVSDLFVHPAVWIEAFGLSIIEAMAASKPIIMTDHWALMPLLKNEPIGHFIPKESPESLAKSLLFFISNPEEAARMGKRGREVTEEYFDIHHMTQEIINLYQNITS